MDDFSTHPTAPNHYGFTASPENLIEPGKRPLSSISPLIIYNSTSGNVKIVAGASGGGRIISTTAQVIMRLLWFGQNPRDAIAAPRFFNQLQPLDSDCEAHMPEVSIFEKGKIAQLLRPPIFQAIIEELMKRGHSFANSDYYVPSASIISVGDDGRVYASGDMGIEGFPTGY